MKDDLLYISSIRSRIEWGEGKTPEIEIDPATGYTYLADDPGNNISGEYWKLPLTEYQKQIDTDEMFINSSDVEISLMFPFIEGTHNIYRGQLLIAL